MSLAIRLYQGIEGLIPLQRDDKICKKYKIQHRTIKFKHPWTNGMIESFNKKTKRKILTRYRFQTIFEMIDKVIAIHRIVSSTNI
ncbi:MAG: transposase [Candidatus Stahlbacteria bacterium]|nr:transposase [Candidatus Stahlbacteria bacterium]